MSDELIVCDGCGRHVRAGDARCPFCTASTPRDGRAQAARAAAAACLAVAAGLSLQACYGGPPRPRSYAYEQHRPGGASLQVASEPSQEQSPSAPAQQASPEP
jgi:hypothetical protein